MKRSGQIHRAGDFRRVGAKSKLGDSTWYVRQVGKSGHFIGKVMEDKPGRSWVQVIEGLKGQALDSVGHEP